MMDIVAMHKDKKAQAEFARKAMQIYEAHRAEWEAQYAGHIVAIDVDSGDFFIGPTLGKANDLAYAKYPDKWIYFVRIGEPERAIALRTW